MIDTHINWSAHVKYVIADEMDDLKDELDTIFRKAMNEIRKAYWSPLFVTRAARHELEVQECNKLLQEAKAQLTCSDDPGFMYLVEFLLVKALVGNITWTDCPYNPNFTRIDNMRMAFGFLIRNDPDMKSLIDTALEVQ